MADKIQGNNHVGCKVKDLDGPPTPQVRIALATAGLGDLARFRANNPPAVGGGRIDPGYLELGNWEPGTKFQVLNKSADPTATFDNPDCIITLDPTGRDIDARVASVWIDDAGMKKLNLKAGHDIQIRAIDDAGNPSGVTHARLQGAGYGAAGQTVHENQWVPASRIRLLDGEANYKDLVLRHIADDTPPEIKHFQKEAKLVAGADGNVTLNSVGTLERDCRVQVMNGNSGKVVNGVVDPNQKLSIPLGNDVKNGDVLFATISDVNGVRADKVELRYSADCKDGRGSSLGIIAARLPGAIK